ncbi:hypothetical protein D1505_24940 [Escherichia coli]|nr:hypothetical protein D1505_24940 [Escherichia coli]
MFGICQFPLYLSGILPFKFFNFALHVNLLLKIPDILEMFVKIPKRYLQHSLGAGVPVRDMLRHLIGLGLFI